jgi:murein tripeptide amidase MpaA
MHENLGASIAEENEFSVYAGKPNRTSVIDFDNNVPIAGLAPNSTWFNSYHSIADHQKWVSDLVAAYPSNSEVVSAGKSVEGRDIKGIHIWGSGGKGSQKAVVWHGTVHAREWITTMVRIHFLSCNARLTRQPGC